ncbi:MAG: hypothetical protein J6W87_01710, partial [Clostridia bacterium]|nr:hypothetical protein [Clostridia bacterium]
DEQVNQSILAQLSMLVQPIFTPLGFGSQLGTYGWVFIVAAISGLIAKENVIATFATLAACLAAMAGSGVNLAGLDIEAEEGIDAVQAMISATGIGIPGLIAFIAFNMTTIPCFAAVGTAKAELMNNKSYKGTLIFWIVSSFLVASAVYTIGSWWWTAFIWAAAIALTTWCIISYNKKANEKLNDGKLK